jgi:hypothetical protein
VQRYFILNQHLHLAITKDDIIQRFASAHVVS